MRFSTFVSLVPFLSSAYAQTFATYTDASTGIEFWQATLSDSDTTGGLQFGLALPPASAGLDYEYIGHFVGALTDGVGWSGLSHNGAMTSSLLLVAWPDGTDIKTSFRYASGYVAPDIYTGNATLTPIASTVNSTHWSLTYRCQWCWAWDQDGTTGSQVPATTASAAQLVGWVQATVAPTTPDDADSAILQHKDDGLFGAAVASARNTAYTSWISLATATPAATGNATTSSNVTAAATATATGNSTSSATSASATATATVSCSNNTVPSTTYDYIVVGAGAGGIPLADKLSEAGHSVLLIERGPPSSGRWGGTMKPDWLEGTNLTRFDVPGLCNEIWVDSAGIACPDVSEMAGCVLGGGTAVNAALWWKANPADFDDNFPNGWKSSDMQPAIERVFEKIPWTDLPSANGQRYYTQGYDVVGGALAAGGWKNVTANDVPGEKNMTFTHTPYMYSHGERAGPMATYLVDAHARSNFKLWTNTTVNRVIRNGAHITGVEVAAFGEGGYCGTVNVTASTGRVILSAGTFGTSKILFRSGIGPSDMLSIVSSSTDGPTMIDESEWIDLPVGHNLDDHTNTDVVIQHPNVTFYDFYGAYTDPITSDKEAYLNSRDGILTQSAPNIGPIAFDEITASDGSVRQLQWTARVEGSHGFSGNQSMTISQYLGRGSTSRGRLAINKGLTVTVSEVPYLQTDDDVAAVVAGIKNLQKALSSDPKITWLYPASNQTVEDFVSAYPLTASYRSANHWIGTSKMGTDSGLVNNGTSVVDTNTKVYGTDNLFVVDASIFPGMMSNNPSALIVAVAEHASEKILALAASDSTNVTTTTGTANTTSSIASESSSATIVIPESTGASSIAPISTSASSIAAISTSAANGTTSTPPQPTVVSSATSASSSSAAAHYQQCGGLGHTGATTCVAPYTCKSWNQYYSQPILRLLTIVDCDQEDEFGTPRRPWAYSFPFTNVSVTTIECSIVCPRHLVQELFMPLMEKLDKKSGQQISISKDDFVVIQVGGEGMAAGQRVLDLTAPLALAGISIFFITSYYSDFILVPHGARSAVIKALEDQGFAFETHVNGHGSNMTNLSSPLHGHNRNTSSTSTFDLQPPGTPPPATVAEWQTKTFATLRKNKIEPYVDCTLELKTCAGYRSDEPEVQDKLTLGIMKSLLSGPRFLSITLTEADTVSLTLERGLLEQFACGGKDILLQDDEIHKAIVLDLRDLPDESAGIVCGVAGRLLERMASLPGPPFNMSYLSTAKAGNVIVLDDEVEDALDALRAIEEENIAASAKLDTKAE
ncbi:hypothetical protein MBLNU459_g3382t2 [Dothideomycetes sp. NU459]